MQPRDCPRAAPLVELLAPPVPLELVLMLAIAAVTAAVTAAWKVAASNIGVDGGAGIDMGADVGAGLGVRAGLGVGAGRTRGLLLGGMVLTYEEKEG